ncbi:Integral Membrane Protein [Streptomyces leeuwenhoekii]|uniref:Integral Membrane Protein n=2 Tax=Streptomyces leeuwenhoekii TaxID=1437453 RepID=A0A0F7VUE8_STRLW|nr:phosphatase PAP2 family protein [Streptomyces leeuwenhoekii]CQR60596.1 Integral Membrane Protein [Streptomyces leeuwenhoekii]
MNARTEPAEAEPDASARPPLVRELLLVAGLFLVYKSGRALATGHTGEAFRNAHHVWDLERTLHLPGEGAVQSLLLHGDALVRLANTYYATVHFPATAAFLIWLYLRRPAHYVWARRVLAAVTAAALVLHLVLPLAPPRMLAAAGLIDTGRVYGPSVYGPPQSDHLSNQFAAMPSLHFGWALMLAIGLMAATRSRLRPLWLLHPLLTLLVIVGTANHYWLDAIAATALLGLALALIRPPHRAAASAGPGPGEPAAAARGHLAPAAEARQRPAPDPEPPALAPAATSTSGGRPGPAGRPRTPPPPGRPRPAPPGDLPAAHAAHGDSPAPARPGRKLLGAGR